MMGLFRRHPKSSEIAEAQRIRDVQFAEVDAVIEKAHQSVKIMENYMLAEKRRTVLRGKT